MCAESEFVLCSFQVKRCLYLRFEHVNIFWFEGHMALGWIQGGAQIGCRGVPALLDVFFRPDGHSNNVHMVVLNAPM